MPFAGVRLKPSTKLKLEILAGKDYSIDEVVNILLDNFIDYSDVADSRQRSLFDYQDECPECGELMDAGTCSGCGYPEE